MFQQVPQRPSAVDHCEAEIRRAILAGEVAPGERLPPERALAEQFGVNRVTVRSALDRLSAANLLRVRQGSGYVVRDFRSEGGPDLIGGLAAVARETGELAPVAADLFLVRRHLARALLERIVHGTAGDARREGRARVQAAFDRFAALVEQGADTGAVAAADLEVIGELVAITGSPVLRLCLNPIVSVLAELPELRQAVYADPGASLAGYPAVIAWLADPDPAAIDPFLADFERRDAETVARLAGDPVRGASAGASADAFASPEEKDP